MAGSQARTSPFRVVGRRDAVTTDGRRFRFINGGAECDTYQYISLDWTLTFTIVEPFHYYNKTGAWSVSSPTVHRAKRPGTWPAGAELDAIMLDVKDALSRFEVIDSKKRVGKRACHVTRVDF